MSKKPKKGDRIWRDHPDGKRIEMKHKNGAYRLYVDGKEVYKSEGYGNSSADDVIRYADRLINQALGKTEGQTTPNQESANITAEQLEEEKLKERFNIAIQRHAYENNISEAEARKRILADPSLLKGTDFAKNYPEELKSYIENSFPDDLYISSLYFVNKTERLGDLGKIYEKDKKARSDIFDDFVDDTLDKREKRENTETDLLLNEGLFGGKYKTIADALKPKEPEQSFSEKVSSYVPSAETVKSYIPSAISNFFGGAEGDAQEKPPEGVDAAPIIKLDGESPPNPQANLDPELLRRIALESEGEGLKELGKRQSQEALKEKNKINPDPTSLWNTVNKTYQPPTIYDSDSYYDKKAHQLGIIGQNFGSTSTIANREGKNRARYEADHKAKLDLFDRFMNYGTINRNDWIRINQEERNSMTDPFKTSADIMDTAIKRDNDNQYKQDVFRKDVAEGEMSNQGKNLAEELDKYNTETQMMEQRRQESINTAARLYDLARQTQDFTNLDIQQKANLWAQRQQILQGWEGLRLNAEQQKAVQEAKEAAAKGDKIAFFTKLAGAAAIIATTGGAGVGAAVGILAPEAGKMLDGKYSFGPLFGGGASAQSSIDPLVGKIPGVN